MLLSTLYAVSGRTYANVSNEAVLYLVNAFSIFSLRSRIVALLSVLLLTGCDSDGNSSDADLETFFGIAIERTPLNINDTVIGTLSGGDPRSFNFVGTAGESVVRDTNMKDSSYVHVYRIESEGPTELQVTSSDFIGSLVVLNEAGTVVRFNGNGALTDLLKYTALAEEAYYAVVTSFFKNMTGRYALSVRTPEVVPLGISVEQDIARGTTVTGTLEATDARLSDLTEEILNGFGEGVLADAYRLTGTGGVTLLLESTAFDAGLLLISDLGSFVDSDNDSGIGTNARLPVALGNQERVYVLVSSYAPGETGNYTLSVTDSDSVFLQ